VFNFSTTLTNHVSQPMLDLHSNRPAGRSQPPQHKLHSAVAFSHRAKIGLLHDVMIKNLERSLAPKLCTAGGASP
jgi:hypothetical protein